MSSYSTPFVLANTTPVFGDYRRPQQRRRPFMLYFLERATQPPESPMALGRPHVGMKIAVCRANKVRERAAPQAGNKSKRHNPRPAPLDSGPVPGYRAGSSTESPMALLRPHERMKIAEYPMLVLEQAPALRYPPTPGLRPRIGVRGMLSSLLQKSAHIRGKASPPGKLAEDGIC